jgi:hypothetical protein
MNWGGNGRIVPWFLRALRACALSTALLAASGAAAAELENFVTVKTGDGCAYDVALPTYPDAKYRNSRVAEEKKRARDQIWQGACIKGRAHGVGTLLQANRFATDETLRGIIFVNGKHLWGPYISENPNGSSVSFTRYVVSFVSPRDVEFSTFTNTNIDGSVNSPESYKIDIPTAFITTDFTWPAKRTYTALHRDPSYCKQLAWCIVIGSQSVPCRTDCRREWDQESAKGLALLDKYLADNMPKFEAAALAGGVDTSGVKTLLAPIIARAEALRVKQVEWKKADADAARREASRTATQAGRLTGSPSLDKLVKLSLGAKP